MRFVCGVRCNVVWFACCRLLFSVCVFVRVLVYMCLFVSFEMSRVMLRELFLFVLRCVVCVCMGLCVLWYRFVCFACDLLCDVVRCVSVILDFVCCCVLGVLFMAYGAMLSGTCVFCVYCLRVCCVCDASCDVA